MPPAATRHHTVHAPTRHAENAVATTAVDRWRLLAGEAAAAPGFMTLRAVREHGVVVDFVWDFASASATRLLRTRAGDLVGRRLLDDWLGLQGRDRVFAQYRGVVERHAPDAVDHVHRLGGLDDIHRHAAVRLGDGVAVALTNLSAAGRANALRQAMLSNGMARW
jgi:hypothetical protein